MIPNRCCYLEKGIETYKICCMGRKYSQSKAIIRENTCLYLKKIEFLDNRTSICKYKSRTIFNNCSLIIKNHPNILKSAYKLKLRKISSGSSSEINSSQSAHIIFLNKCINFFHDLNISN